MTKPLFLFLLCAIAIFTNGQDTTLYSGFYQCGMSSTSIICVDSAKAIRIHSNCSRSTVSIMDYSVKDSTFNGKEHRKLNKLQSIVNSITISPSYHAKDTNFIYLSYKDLYGELFLSSADIFLCSEQDTLFLKDYTQEDSSIAKIPWNKLLPAKMVLVWRNGERTLNTRLTFSRNDLIILNFNVPHYLINQHTLFLKIGLPTKSLYRIHGREICIPNPCELI